METTFFTFNNFLLSRSLSVQASPTHRLLLFAIEAGTSLVRLKYHLGCTVDSCIIAKCRDHDRSILAGLKSILSVIFPDTVNKRLSGLGNSSADNNGLRICHTANNGKSIHPAALRPFPWLLQLPDHSP